MKDEDPLQELRRIRNAIAKECNYDGKAIGRYLSSVPLLPGQKMVDLSAQRKKKAASSTRPATRRTAPAAKVKAVAKRATAKPARRRKTVTPA